MASDLLYLSNAHVQELQITAREAREAVLAGFRDTRSAATSAYRNHPLALVPAPGLSR